MLLAVAVPLLLATALPAELQVRRYGSAEALASTELRGVLQDKTGFLWLATHQGLLRFDGQDFLAFRHDASDPTSLADDEVRTLLEDSRGRMWVGTAEGLALFDREHRRFVNTVDGDAGVHQPQGVNALFESASGTVWFGSRDEGVCRVEALGVYRCVKPASPHVMAIAEGREGALWLGTEAGVERFDPRTGRADVVPLTSEADAQLSVNALLRDPDGTLWVGTYGDGLFQLDPDGHVTRHFLPDPADPASLSAKGVKALLRDREGVLWVATWSGGLSLFDPASGRFARYRHDPDDPRSLSDDRVVGLFEDTLGQVWISTYAGLDVHDPRSRAFVRLRHQQGVSNSLAEDKVQSVLEDHAGALWVGTFGRGVTRYEPGTGSFTTFHHEPADPGSLANNGVWALHEDAQGRLWLGTSRGLHRFEPQSGHFIRYQQSAGDSAPFSSNNILSITSDHEGVLWLGTWETGLDRFDPTTGAVRNFPPRPADPTALPGSGIWSVRVDAKDRLWVATNAGLARLDHGSDAFVRFSHDATPGSLSNDDVRVIAEDAEGRLWVGTGAGLDRFVEETATFEHALEGLDVQSLLEGAPGELWLGSSHGLLRFEVATGHLQTFDEADGLPPGGFVVGAATRSRAGRLFFGSAHGVTAFDPAQVHENTRVPEVVMTGFQLLNRAVKVGQSPVLPSDIAFTREVVLGPRDYSFAFEFAALNLRQPEKNRTRYRLEGLDPDWVTSDPRYRRVTYTGLAPGHYVFHVQGSNDDGYWNERGTSVRVTIEPWWWESWWARALAVALVLLGLALFVRWKDVSLRRRNEALAALVAARTAELEAINRRLEDASLTDPLTRLRNRRFVVQHLEPDVAKVMRDWRDPARRAAANLTFIVIDIDFFKRINDEHGHHGGDLVLTTVAAALKQTCRESDFVSRWGGEEFLVVERFSSRAAAFASAERIRQAIGGRPIALPGGKVLNVTASVGVACFPFLPERPDALSWEQVVGIADRGLYAAKHGGRNATVCLEATSSTVVTQLLAGPHAPLEALAAEGRLIVRATPAGGG